MGSIGTKINKKNRAVFEKSSNLVGTVFSSCLLPFELSSLLHVQGRGRSSDFPGNKFISVHSHEWSQNRVRKGEKKGRGGNKYIGTVLPSPDSDLFYFVVSQN